MPTRAASNGRRQSVCFATWVGDELAQAEAAYESTEAAFLGVVRAAADRATVATAARTVAQAAEAWNMRAYASFHRSVPAARDDLDRLTERTELLSELWADVAAAYQARSGDR